MYIQKIEIENIRGFEKVALDLTRPDGSFPGWTVIAGVNGSGKTTFLRSVALSVAALSTALALAESYEDGWLRADQPSGETRARVVRSEGDHFKPNKRNKQGLTHPSAFWLGLRWNAEAEPSVEALIDLNPEGERHAPPDGPCAERPEGWFIVGYGPFRRISGGAPAAKLVTRGRSRVARIARLVSLFRDDVPLVECVEWLQALDYRSKEVGPQAKEAEQLKQDVLALLGDHLLPSGARVVRVDSDGLWVERDGLQIVHAQLSEGYKTVTALVLDIVRNLAESFKPLKIKREGGKVIVLPHGVVLIDEIDAHLHIEWQKRLGFWLKEHFPNIQFIVTTHSPFICQAADPKGLIRLPAPGSKERVEHVPEHVYNLVVNGSAEDAVMSELFGRERPYSDAAEALREEISTLEARVIQSKATKDEKARLKKLRTKLPTTLSAQVEDAVRKLAVRLDAKKEASR